MLKSFAGSGSAQGGKDMPSELFTEQQAREAGDQMGVRFISGEVVKTADMEGYHARYAFDDITKVKMKMEPEQPAPGRDQTAAANAPLGFDFVRGASSSILTIHLPDQKPKSPLGDTPLGQMKDVQQNEQALAMVKTMMAGLFVDISMAFDGRVINANVPTSAGGRLTLLQMDFDKVMADPAALQKLQQSETLIGLQNVPGVTVVPTPTLKIEFR